MCGYDIKVCICYIWKFSDEGNGCFLSSLMNLVGEYLGFIGICLDGVDLFFCGFVIYFVFF